MMKDWNRKSEEDTVDDQKRNGTLVQLKEDMSFADAVEASRENCVFQKK